MTWESILKGMKLEHPKWSALKELIDDIARKKKTFTVREMYEMVQTKPVDKKMGAIGSRPWLRYKQLDVHAINRYFQLSSNYQKSEGEQRSTLPDKGWFTSGKTPIKIWSWKD